MPVRWNPLPWRFDIIGSVAAGGGVTQINTDSGNITPTAGVVIIKADDTTDDNVNGITSLATLPSTETIFLTNRIVGTVTTTDATLTTVATFDLGGTPGVFTFFGMFSGFIGASGRGGSYFCYASARTNGTIATEIGSDINTIFEDAAMVDSDVFFTVDGANNVLFQCQGVVGASINWRLKSEYTLVT